MFDILFIEKKRLSITNSKYKKTLFLNLYTDWIDYAKKEVQKNGKISVNSLDISFSEIQDYLIKITEKVLFIEYNVFIEDKTFISNDSIYQFEYLLLNSSYRKYLLAEYPELFKLAYNALINFIKNLNEIILRFFDDYEEIEKSLNINLSSEIDYIRLGLGDKHNAHKSVSLIVLKNKNKIIYKPRNLDIDVFLYQFFSYYNEKCCTNLNIANSLNKGSYGWAKFIYKEKISQDNIKTYFNNFGHLLSVLYVINASDIHYENILSTKNGITLIDCETIFSTILKEDDFKYLNVLSVGLLSNKLKIGGTYIDFGGITVLENKKQISSLKSEEIFIDDNGMYNKENNVDFSNNIETNNNETINIADNIEHIINGFQKSYIFLLENKKELISIFSKIPQTTQIRHLTRHTFVYSHILDQSINPIFLINENKRKSFLKQLSLSHKENPYLKITYNYDLLALYNNDIPYYYCNFFSRSLRHKHEDLKSNYFNFSPFELLLKKINNLTTSDMNMQIWLIKYSFLDNSKTFNLITEKKLESNITHIYNFFSNIVSTNNFYHTVTQSYGNNNKYSIEISDPNLIFGTLGDILFLKESNSFFYDKNIQIIIDRIYQESIDILKKNPPKNIGFAGIAGLIYFLIRMFKVEKEEKYLNDLYFFIKTINLLDLFFSCNNYGLISGKAGILLSLVQLYKISPNYCTNEIENMINLFYKNIEANAISYSIDQVYWKSEYHKTPLCGMAHGIAGICISLLEYFSIFKNKDAKILIKKAIQYENSFFNKSKLNWRDNRDFIKSEKEAYNSFGWSHGSPGIGLSRLKILESELFKGECFNNTIIEDLDNSVKSTILNGFNGKLDSLIFGKYGCAELIIKYAKYRKNSVFVHDLKGLVNTNIDEMNYIENNKGLLIPGLFCGISGYGYQLLYFNNMIKKSILMFEV
ncbi:type 2 lanthipeptide synthetase LanM family protein [Chryseobacterium contaminans]|uniref:type 2 lanthipeptide synthetase LanM family protein n=1 Tax=Chryseobacterium contaminans TaxID=1423959 RepID=UPI0030188A2D